MDFVTGLPRSLRGHDAVWVIVDRLTKFAYFLPIRLSNSAKDHCILYVHEIVRLHGGPSIYRSAFYIAFLEGDAIRSWIGFEA